MAARGGESRTRIYVFLIGHGLMVLGFIFFTVGFATDHWLSTSSTRFGLWEKCVSGSCVTTSTDFQSWTKAVRAMLTMALISYMAGILLALFFHCTSQTLPIPKFSFRERILEISASVGCILCLIGISVYGAKGDKSGTLQYSYGLTVFSLILFTPGTIMVAITRNSITNTSSINPHPQESVDASFPTTVSSQIPRRPQTVPSFLPTNGRDSNHGQNGHFPYGRGQRRPDNGQNSDGIPFSYGGDSPTRNSAALPYPVYPAEPGTHGGSPSEVDSMSMSEPGSPERDRGGGARGRGRGHGTPTGQPRVQGRLPPIFEVSPSAPPPSSEHDRPPSYLEAIGHVQP